MDGTTIFMYAVLQSHERRKIWIAMALQNAKPLSIRI
jgi:hypothetical protein